MPKLEPAGTSRKISLSQIVDTGNIRENYTDIKELAESIKKNGQLQPVVVKVVEGKNGEEQFELIAGFRRRAAFQYLCDHGDDFKMISATIVTGDKLTLQLVENIQRSDLSARERERAIFQMFESGLKQNEIAARLSKGKSFVSVNLSAYKMRILADKNNIDIKNIETSTLSELLGIPDNDLPELLKELINFGGTRAAARSLARTYQKKKNPPLDTFDDPNMDMQYPADSSTRTPADPENTEEKTKEGPEPEKSEEPPQDKNTENPVPEAGKPPAPAIKPRRPPLLRKPEQEPIEPEHAVIDVNIILTTIHSYIDGIKKKIEEKGGFLADTAKIDAANDIIALIHERLNNA
jgi:ParB/RepB/Spo0J family partition protein